MKIDRRGLLKSIGAAGAASAVATTASAGAVSFRHGAASGAAGSSFLAAFGIVLRPIVACTLTRQLRWRVFGLRN